MRVLRVSSVEEYSSWYLERDRRKHPDRTSPEISRSQVQTMQQFHPGKMRDWFNVFTRWQIVSLDAIDDLTNLVFLESEWTKKERLVVPDGPNYRLLGRVAKNAIAEGYLGNESAHRHKAYYDKLASGSLRIQAEERVAICSAEESEIRSNPDAKYYLLDGVGRCLPFMMLMMQRKQEFSPLEAFLAEK
jgi:hypothetical protein